MCKGFIMLSRSFFENELWEAKRTYSDAEAWLDLIQLARFEDGERTVRIGKVEVVEKRGQVATTLCALADSEDIHGKNYHFEEHYEGDNIAFDYKIRPGRCTTTNAKHLMRIAGLLDTDNVTDEKEEANVL